MLVIALVFEGKDRRTAAETCWMNRQTLRDWVHRYNTEGLAGLKNRKAPGRPCRLTAAQKAELAALVEKGPDTENDGVVRWRCADLKALDRGDVRHKAARAHNWQAVQGFRLCAASKERSASPGDF